MTTLPVPEQRGAAAGDRDRDRDRPSDKPEVGRVLMERAQAGDAQAFGAIYSRYQDQIFRYVYFRCRGNQQLAEDLTHDTFLRALKRIDTFLWQGRDVGAWLVTIARNLVTDHYKSGRYRLEVTTGDMIGPDDDARDGVAAEDPLTRAITTDTGRVVTAAMGQLNEHQRTVLELRFLGGLSVAETALKMDLQEGAVKALQYRAVRSLARDPRIRGLAPWAVAAA